MHSADRMFVSCGAGHSAFPLKNDFFADFGSVGGVSVARVGAGGDEFRDGSRADGHEMDAG
jgi:hypothetical protein